MSHATIDFLSPETPAALAVEIQRDRQPGRDSATPRDRAECLPAS